MNTDLQELADLLSKGRVELCPMISEKQENFTDSEWKYLRWLHWEWLKEKGKGCLCNGT